MYQGETYSIVNIQRQAAGDYTCTAWNGVGEQKNATATVNVQCKLLFLERFSNDFRKTKTQVMAWLLLTLTGKPLFFAQGIKITSALLLLQALYMA